MCYLLNRYRWTKDGKDFDLHKDSQLIIEESSGSFLIPNTKDKAKYQGKYRCYASNKLGTAMSEESEFIVPSKSQFINIPCHTLSQMLIMN